MAKDIDFKKLFGRPPIYTDPKEMEAVILEYFEESKTTAGKYQPTIEGLTLHLGFATRKSLMDYGERNADFLNVINRAKSFIKSCYEKQLYGFAWAGAQFALRNLGKEDWTDETKQIQIQEKVNADFGTTIQPPSKPTDNT